MKKSFLILFYQFMFGTILIAQSPTKINNVTTLTSNSWKVINYKESDTSKLKQPSLNQYGQDGAYILNFWNDKTVYFNIFDNSSGGRYETNGDKTIKMNVCKKETARCCPSPSDNILFQLLSKPTSYTIVDDTLILKGPNSEINFQKIPGKKLKIIELFDSAE